MLYSIYIHTPIKVVKSWIGCTCGIRLLPQIKKRIDFKRNILKIGFKLLVEQCYIIIKIDNSWICDLPWTPLPKYRYIIRHCKHDT